MFRLLGTDHPIHSRRGWRVLLTGFRAGSGCRGGYILLSFATRMQIEYVGNSCG